MKGPVLHFGPLDIAVTLFFIAAILALGFSVRLRSNSILQFLAAGRMLTLPLFVASLVSMWYGDVLGVGESISSFGAGTWALFGVPYYFFGILYALTYARRVRSADQLSIPERLELRFGKGAAIAGAVLLFFLAAPTAHVLMLGTLVQSLTGGKLIYCVVIGAGIGASFLFRGGLLADARVSLLAFTMMYVGFAVMAIWCVSHYPLVATISSIQNKDLLKWDGATGWIYVLSLFILGAWTFVDPGFHQRVASGASVQVGVRGVLISVVFWCLFDGLSTLVGLYALALHSSDTGLLMFPSFAEQTLPSGLKAVFFCGMLGTIISALVGYSLVAGTTIGREIIVRVFPRAIEDRATSWSRIGIALALLTAVILALEIESVVDLWTNWAGAVVGALLIPFCIAYLKSESRARSSFVTASIILSFLLSVAWMGYGKLHGNDYLELVFLRTPGGLRIVMPNSSASPASQAVLTSGTKMAIGTLLPGLLVSLVVIGIGTAFGRERSYGKRRSTAASSQ